MNPVKQRRIMILLADDEPAIRKMVKVRLEHDGFEVVMAGDGEEALKSVFEGEKVDLILLDIKMPKLDGFEVCKRLKENPATAGIPLVLFTASSSQWPRLSEQCRELGISGWVKKPFRSAQLLEEIHHALKEGGAHHV